MYHLEIKLLSFNVIETSSESFGEMNESPKMMLRNTMLIMMTSHRN